MAGPLGDRLAALFGRLRRIERTERRLFRRWVEQTSNLLHLSVLLFVPLLIAVVTALANRIESLSFLLFPPLAAGTYTLFSNPESRQASPTRFVAGLTIGALCGWGAIELSAAAGFEAAPGPLGVSAVGAATAVFLTAVVIWPLDVEEASAFSTALLGLLVRPGDEPAFVASVFLASSIVAAVFAVWRSRFYEQRAQLLYESIEGDDHVLVPMRGPNPDETAMLAARLAAAHEAGKVVLLDLVGDEDLARTERELLGDRRRTRTVADGGPDDGPAGDDEIDIDHDGTGSTTDRGSAAAGRRSTDAEMAAESPASSPDETDDAVEDAAARQAAATATTRLEDRAAEIETTVGVPCQVAVAVEGDPATTVRSVARETDCDLIATAHERQYGGLSPYIRGLLGGETDVLVHRSVDGRTEWSDVLVPVRHASDVAHSMLDFAARLAGDAGRISLATCVGSERERRRGEEMLANLAETVDRPVETRVATASVEAFLERNAGAYDLIIVGSSTNRSRASRLVSPPTSERVKDLDADLAVVDRH